MKLAHIQYSPRFGSWKKLAATGLLIGVPVLAVTNESTAQIQQPPAKVKQPATEQKITSVKELSEFREVLIKQERQLAQSLINWAYEMPSDEYESYMNVFRDEEGKITPKYKQITKLGAALGKSREVLIKLRTRQDPPAHPPTLEGIKSFELMAFLAAKFHQKFQNMCPLWSDPNAFGLLYGKKQKIIWGKTDNGFDAKKHVKAGHDWAKQYADLRKAFLKQRIVVLKGIQTYNKAAQNLKRPSYMPYWGLSKRYIEQLTWMITPQATQKKK